MWRLKGYRFNRWTCLYTVSEHGPCSDFDQQWLSRVSSSGTSNHLPSESLLLQMSFIERGTFCIQSMRCVPKQWSFHRLALGCLVSVWPNQYLNLDFYWISYLPCMWHPQTLCAKPELWFHSCANIRFVALNLDYPVDDQLPEMLVILGGGGGRLGELNFFSSTWHSSNELGCIFWRLKVIHKIDILTLLEEI